MRNLSLNKKISVIISLFILCSIIISYFGIKAASDIHDDLVEVESKVMNRIEYAHFVDEYILKLRVELRGHILAKDPAKMKSIEQEILKNTADVLKYLSAYEEIATETGKKNIEQMRLYFQEWLVRKDETIALSSSYKKDEAAEMTMTVLPELLRKIDTVINEIIERNTNDAKRIAKENEEHYKSSRNIVLVVSFISISIGIGLSVIVFGNTGKVINHVITSLTDSSVEVASASRQISSSSEELSQAAIEQAASLQQTAASIEEMTAMIKLNSENSRKTNELSSVSYNSASQGQKVVSRMIEAINEINASNGEITEHITESNQKISEIVKIINDIGNKTKVINEIVFQTKLLSVNASVEAARAGEHGRGFSVVAEEVGNLAQMSGNAAKEIAQMLDESIHKVDSVVRDTKQMVERLIRVGTEKVGEGVRIAHECGAVLEEIVLSVNKVSRMANEISTSSEEQAQGVEEISKAVSQLDEVTQQNAAAAEQTAASSEELSAQAERMKELVDTLVFAIKGHVEGNDEGVRRGRF